MTDNLFALLERNAQRENPVERRERTKTKTNNKHAPSKGTGQGNSKNAMTNLATRKAAENWKAIQALEGGNFSADEIIWVHPKEIVGDPLQPRGHVEVDDEIKQLAERLRQSPMLHPIAVRPPLRMEKDLSDAELKRPENSRFRIIAGERRWLASMEAGMKSIPVRVFPNLTDVEVAILQGQENADRKDLTPRQWANYYRRLRDEFGMTVREIAASLGANAPHFTTVAEYIQLSEDENLLSAVDSGAVVIRQARKILPLSPELRKKAIKEISRARKDGRIMDAKEVENMARELQGKPPKSAPARNEPVEERSSTPGGSAPAYNGHPRFAETPSNSISEAFNGSGVTTSRGAFETPQRATERRESVFPASEFDASISEGLDKVIAMAATRHKHYGVPDKAQFEGRLQRLMELLLG